MKLNDIQLGEPSQLYKDTKANIEALSGLTEGCTAYATDTNERGAYDGLSWKWDRVDTVAKKSANYTLTILDEIVVFTANASADLPAATGTGRTYRIVARNCTVTINGNGSDTIKGELSQIISGHSDLIITDTETGIWE